MPTPFQRLHAALVEHLRELKAAGVRHIPVSPEALAWLNQRPGPAPRRAAAFRIERPAPPSSAVIAPPLTPRPAPPPASVPAPVEIPLGPPKSKEEAIQEIRARALECQKCPHLVRTRTQVVFGVGNLDAELMFVGEAPGVDEDRMGEPFVGKAGQLLTRIIQTMGFTRDTVYIANILKCRPDMPAGARGNRPPREDEMDTCKPYLHSQIDIIRPRVLVALGATAAQGLLGMRSPINALRGRWREFRGIPVMPTYHPSYLLRAEDGPDRGRAEKRKAWEDMLLVLEKLGRPITPKMRGYFLPPGAAAGGGA